MLMDVPLEGGTASKVRLRGHFAVLLDNNRGPHSWV